MGFEFRGFCVRADAALIQAAHQQWPESRGRVFKAPFQGVCVKLPELDEYLREHGWERDDEAWEVLGSIEAGLPAWSRRYPDLVFVYIEAECHAGTCAYEGYVCRNGEVITREANAVAHGILTRLVAYLGVQLDASEDFAPLTRW